MSILDSIRNWFLAPLLQDQQYTHHLKEAEERRNYRTGDHRRYIKKSITGVDDNLVINFSGLIIDRSVSMLFGKGIKFDLPGPGDTPEQVYIDAVMDANKQQILLHKLAILGGEQGTCYLKIIPDSLQATLKTVDLETQQETAEDILVPRLVPQDPAFVSVDTHHEDKDDVIRYVIKYAVTGPDGKPMSRKQVIERDDGVEITENEQQEIMGGVTWIIIDYEWGTYDNDWREIGRQVWAYEFPPMLHWQNLPEPTTVEGAPDLTDDVIELQDRLNFDASNISKIIRLYANPQRWGKKLGQTTKITLGPDEMPNFNNDNAELNQLEPLGDLPAANSFLSTLRGALFDITQTTDLTSFGDRIPQLTNFGLRVLFSDSLAKLATKRELYGDALLELVRRLLVMAELDNTDPGQIIWPEPLPVDEREQGEVIKNDLELGLVDKQTASTKRGYDWEEVKTRLEEEGVAANANENNIGALLLRNFNRGLGGNGNQQ